MDLAIYDREITKRELQVLELQKVIADYKKIISKCANEGFFYSCKNNTGKKLNDWRDARNLAEKDLVTLNKELVKLRQQRKDAAVAIEKSLEIRGIQAGVDVKEAIASGELAQKYGKWLLLVVFGLGFGYFAIKKVKS